MNVAAVIIVNLHLDDLAEGDAQTEVVRDVVRAVGEAVRHRLVKQGVRVAGVSSALVSEPEPE